MDWTSSIPCDYSIVLVMTHPRTQPRGHRLSCPPGAPTAVVLHHTRAHFSATRYARRIHSQAPAASASEGGLSATVKKASNKLLGTVGGLLGVTGNAGGGDGKTKAKKSSKSSKMGSKTPGGGGFTEAFEAKHGKR